MRRPQWVTPGFHTVKWLSTEGMRWLIGSHRPCFLFHVKVVQLLVLKSRLTFHRSNTCGSLPSPIQYSHSGVRNSSCCPRAAHGPRAARAIQVRGFPERTRLLRRLPPLGRLPEVSLLLFWLLSNN